MRPAILATLLVPIACSSGGTRQGNGNSLGVADDSSGATASASMSMTDADDGTASGTGNVDTAPSDGSDGGPDASSDPSDPTPGMASSTGDPATCAEDASACDAWFLAPGAGQWEAVDLGGPAALAPSSAVLAAFDIEAPQIAFVLTDDEVIRVDLAQRTWVSKTTFDDRFMQVNAPLVGAFSVPAADGAPEDVELIGTDVAFIYSYDAGADEFTFGESTGFGAGWSHPNAPSGADVLTVWLDLINADGWVVNDVGEVCPGVDGAVGPYLAVVTADAVHVSDAGYCFEFFPPVPFAAFGPFSLPGAPPPERIGGAAYNEATGLVIFAE